MRRHRWKSLQVLLAVFLIAASCHASEAMEDCVDSYVQAQRLRKAGDLLGARTQLLVCMFPRCPGALRRDCRNWLKQVETDLPSFVVEARDAEGNEVAVQVQVDDEPGLHAGGAPFLVNPGPHVFEVHADRAPRATYRVDAHAGEKDRRLRVVVAPSIPREVWILGGLGVLDLGAATYFHFRADDLEDCGDACTPGDDEAAGTARTASYVSLGMAALSFGAAGWLYWTRPKVHWSEPVQSPSAPRISVRAHPGGSMIELTGRF